MSYQQWSSPFATHRCRLIETCDLVRPYISSGDASSLHPCRKTVAHPVRIASVSAHPEELGSLAQSIDDYALRTTIGDLGVRGFLDTIPDPLRYSAATRVAGEATGMICDRVPTGSRVLDVGCGTGSISSLIHRECEAKVVGIEPDPVRAAASAKLGIETHCGLLDRSLSEKLGWFDVVLFADVIEHVQDPVALLEIGVSLLKPDGLVIVSTPNIAHWSIRTALLAGRFDYQPYGIMDATHLRWFTNLTIRRVFAASGLRVVSHDWTSGAWMDCYSGVIGSLVAQRLRRLVRLAPGLFGCQHIVVGVPELSPP
jgi:methionine biosynthesis protein MetW